jgi:hypothetical protein
MAPAWFDFEHFSLYRHHGIDANAIVAAAQSIALSRPIRHLRTVIWGGMIQFVA